MLQRLVAELEEDPAPGPSLQKGSFVVSGPDAENNSYGESQVGYLTNQATWILSCTFITPLLIFMYSF